MAALALVAELFHDVDDGGAGLSVVGRLLEEVLAVIRHAAGDCRHALHHRGQLQQVSEGAAQLVAVVDATAEHELTVQLDAARRQPGQIVEHLAATLVGQHPYPQCGVCRVDRDEDWADMHLDDTVNFVVGQVCQRDIVAEQEGEPLVVILKIERLPHTGRQLVNKAEHTVIGAAVLFIAQIGLEVAAQRLILRLGDLYGAVLLVLTHFQGERGGRCIKLVVQCIVQGMTVDGQQRTAYGKAEALRGGIFIYRCHIQGHGVTLLCDGCSIKNGEGIALPTQETYASFLMTSWPL